MNLILNFKLLSRDHVLGMFLGNLLESQNLCTRCEAIYESIVILIQLSLKQQLRDFNKCRL